MPNAVIPSRSTQALRKDSMNVTHHNHKIQLADNGEMGHSQNDSQLSHNGTTSLTMPLSPHVVKSLYRLVF